MNWALALFVFGVPLLCLAIVLRWDGAASGQSYPPGEDQ